MSASDTIQVQVVHSDALVAAGLAATLREQADMDLVLVAGAFACCGVALEPGVDVVVADYESGLAFLDSVRGEARSRQRAAAAVLIVSQRDTEFEIRHALERGARGFLILGCGTDELVAAVRALRAGLRHIGNRAAQRLADSVAFEALTDREHAVLQLLVQGLGNKVIAHQLGVAIGTVKSHLKSIFQKLNAASRTEVAAVADRRGLLTLPRHARGGAGPDGSARRAGGLPRAALRDDGYRAHDFAVRSTQVPPH